MKRTVNLVAVVALALIGARGAWADHIGAVTGVCNDTSTCERVAHTPTNPANASWTIDFLNRGGNGPDSGGGHVITLDQTSGTTFRWDKGAFLAPLRTTQWWGTVDVGSSPSNEVDRYPLGWGNEVYSAQVVTSSNSLGQTTLQLNKNLSDALGAQNELIYAFKMPTNQQVTQIDVHMDLQRLVSFQARGTDSGSFTEFQGSNDPGGGGGPVDAQIPVNLIDTSSGMAQFQIRLTGTTGPSFVRDNFSVVVTAVPEPAGLMLIGAGMIPLLRRRRRA